MPTEQQELQLKVTLDDEASPQLEQIRAALAGLGGTGASGGGANVSRLVGGMGDAEKAFGNLARGMLGVGRQAVDLAKAIGPMPVALGTLAYQTTRASEASESWSAQMVRVANAARMAGTSVGDFRSVTDSVARGGMSAQTAATMMVNFNQAYGELIRMGSARREHLLNIAGAPFVDNMSRAIRLIGTMRTDVEKLAYVQRLAENASRHARDAAEAEYIREQVYAGFGVPELAMIDQRIVAYDKQTQDNMNAEAAASTKLFAAHTEEQQTRDRIWEILRGSTATWDIWLTKQVTWVEKYLVDLAEKQEQFKRENENKPGWWTHGAYQIPPEAFTAKPQGWINNPFNPVHSPTDEIMGGGEKAVETTDEHTTQLKRLTNNIMKMLADPKALGAIVVTPYQRGGKAPGTQVAMVGEAGPEAVSNPYGTNVITGPTIGRLNAGDTVTPLGTLRQGQFAEQLKDPAIRDRFFAYTEAETGSQGALAQQAFMEETLNRAAARNQTLSQVLGGSYFPARTKAIGGRPPTDAQREAYAPILDSVMGGSNLISYATGNASGTVGFGGGPTTYTSPGKNPERFGIEAQDIGWQYRLGAGGGDASFAGPPADQSIRIPPTAPTASGYSEGSFGGGGGSSGGAGATGTFPGAPYVHGGQSLKAVPMEGRSQLDGMMGNELKVGTFGQIKIEHENPPPGTEIETDGKVFEGATKETTSMPMFDTSDTARWRHPAEQEKDRRREIERAPYQPIEHIGPRG